MGKFETQVEIINFPENREFLNFLLQALENL